MGLVSDYLNSKIGDTQKKEIGIGGFTALARVKDSTRFESEVPSSPLEDGSLVHDHIILKPMTVSIQGVVSDVFLRASPITKRFQQATTAIGDFSSMFAPVSTVSQISKMNELAVSALDAVNKMDALVAKGEQIYSLFGNRDSKSKSQQNLFIDYIEAIHNGRQIISIDMPYRTRVDMRITSFTAEYDNQANNTGFTIEAEKVNFAKVIYANIAAQSPAHGTGGQLANKKDKGSQAGRPVSRSVLSWIVQ